LNSCSFDWVIISRRSIYRVGTRYFVRGADLDGNVANYVETEQLVQFNKSVASFVLTRGSIPFQWTQRPNIKYKPKPKLNTQNDQLLIYKRHIDEQVVLYGRQVLVNLIDQKGGEKQTTKKCATCILTFIKSVPKCAGTGFLFSWTN